MPVIEARAAHVRGQQNLAGSLQIELGRKAGGGRQANGTGRRLHACQGQQVVQPHASPHLRAVPASCTVQHRDGLGRGHGKDTVIVPGLWMGHRAADGQPPQARLKADLSLAKVMRDGEAVARERTGFAGAGEAPGGIRDGAQPRQPFGHAPAGCAGAGERHQFERRQACRPKAGSSPSASIQCHETAVWPSHSVASPTRQAHLSPSAATSSVVTARASETRRSRPRSKRRSNPRLSERSDMAAFQGTRAMSAQPEAR